MPSAHASPRSGLIADNSRQTCRKIADCHNVQSLPGPGTSPGQTPSVTLCAPCFAVRKTHMRRTRRSAGRGKPHSSCAAAYASPDAARCGWPLTTCPGPLLPAPSDRRCWLDRRGGCATSTPAWRVGNTGMCALSRGDGAAAKPCLPACSCVFCSSPAHARPRSACALSVAARTLHCLK